MMYKGGKISRGSSAISTMDNPSYGHMPYKTIRLPRFFGKVAERPRDCDGVNATPEMKALQQEYASFALGNFFPYDRLHHLLTGERLAQ
jgi:hypothetical protein